MILRMLQIISLSQIHTVRELPKLFQSRKAKGMRVIPVIIRPCPWQSEPILKDLQALPKDGKAVIISSTIVEGQGVFMRSLVSFMKSAMQAQEDENMNNLKKLIEANTTDYFPAPVVEAVEE